MIKDVMVWLDGSLGDEVRLEAGIATQFESQVIALVLNPMLSAERRASIGTAGRARSRRSTEEKLCQCLASSGRWRYGALTRSC